MKPVNLYFSTEFPLFFTRSAEIIRFTLGEWFLDSGKNGDLLSNTLLKAYFPSTPLNHGGLYEYISKKSLDHKYNIK